MRKLHFRDREHHSVGVKKSHVPSSAAQIHTIYTHTHTYTCCLIYKYSQEASMHILSNLTPEGVHI